MCDFEQNKIPEICAKIKSAQFLAEKYSVNI